MQFTLATLGLLAAAVSAIPQGVTSAVSPTASAPAGCQTSMASPFQIEVVNVTSSSGSSSKKEKRDTLIITLADGMLHDQSGRTGYIASNNQFQFDKPPQAGAIYTAGWSVCSNGSLTLGGDSIFYSCLSGTFYNLYDENSAAQCSQVYIIAMPYSGSVPSGGVTVQPDGQPTASPVSSVECVSQISDGQPQQHACPVTQISDGQIQQPTGKPVSQISDGQIQATTAAPVSQISDGQIQQATSAAAVSQISDGQIQAPTGANNTVASPTHSVVPYTGAAVLPTARGELLGLAAGVIAAAML